MAYQLYKKSDNLTPFVTVNENTIDSTSTSVFLVGKRKEAYGEPEQQSKLWMLEHFADDTPPTNAINGQAWFNTQDDKLYVCVDENTQTFEKISNPIVAGATPTLSLSTGNLWYNTNDGKLYIWDGSQFDLVGPQSSVPLTVQEENYLTRSTSNATPSELWKDGTTNSRLVIPNNTTWAFEVLLTARRTNANGERRTWKFEGQLDNSSNNVVIDGSVATTIIAKSSGTNNYAATVSADNINKSLKVEVTGESSKDITWNAVVKLTKVSN